MIPITTMMFFDTLNSLAFTVSPAVRILVLAFFSALVTFFFGAFYRWYTKERVPARLAVLVGLGVVALSLN
ncbi:MAG: hypothetical protein SXQ77_04855, partial [Halobacteria archaeon]|nr:hypothetical protein [Halobacteria archaeon]